MAMALLILVLQKKLAFDISLKPRAFLIRSCRRGGDFVHPIIPVTPAGGTHGDPHPHQIHHHPIEKPISRRRCQTDCQMHRHSHVR